MRDTGFAGAAPQRRALSCEVPATWRAHVSVELFRDDDRGYTAWLTNNARGYILDLQRSMNPSDARVNEAAEHGPGPASRHDRPR